jgi:hypothetical protein
MPLVFHLLIHFTLAILTGYLIGRYFNNIKLGLIFGILGGFLIDVDHVLEYFLVFGPTFNLQYFFEGRHFLLSDKIRLYFHAWEYFPILFILAWFFRKRKNIKIALITLALAGAVHLVSDIFINNFYFKYYSFYYRFRQDFSASCLLPSDIYQLNLDYKKELGI